MQCMVVCAWGQTWRYLGKVSREEPMGREKHESEMCLRMGR